MHVPTSALPDKRDRDAKTIELSQTASITEMLERYDMANCNATKVPVSTTADDAAYETSSLLSEQDKARFQSIVGSLQFFANATRPDIAFAVAKLAQHNQSPRVADMQGAKHLLRYLKGNSYTLKYDGSVQGVSNPVVLEAYADASYAGCKSTSLSQSGVVLKIAGAAVHWSSNKQTAHATSSAEAELIALCQAAKDVSYMRSLLNSLGSPCVGPTPVYEDNNAARAIAENDFQMSKKTRHIPLQFRFIGGLQKKGVVKITDINTDDQQADLLTKGLGNVKHHELTKLVTGHWAVSQ